MTVPMPTTAPAAPLTAPPTVTPIPLPEALAMLADLRTRIAGTPGGEPVMLSMPRDFILALLGVAMGEIREREAVTALCEIPRGTVVEMLQERSTRVAECLDTIERETSQLILAVSRMADDELRTQVSRCQRLFAGMPSGRRSTGSESTRVAPA